MIGVEHGYLAPSVTCQVDEPPGPGPSNDIPWEQVAVLHAAAEGPGALHRQLQRAADLLYPEKTLQERRINLTSLVARHGRYVVDWIYDAIDLGSNEHEIVYL